MLNAKSAHHILKCKYKVSLTANDYGTYCYAQTLESRLLIGLKPHCHFTGTLRKCTQTSIDDLSGKYYFFCSFGGTFLGLQSYTKISSSSVSDDKTGRNSLT